MHQLHVFSACTIYYCCAQPLVAHCVYHVAFLAFMRMHDFHFSLRQHYYSCRRLCHYFYTHMGDTPWKPAKGRCWGLICSLQHFYLEQEMPLQVLSRSSRGPYACTCTCSIRLPPSLTVNLHGLIIQCAE